MLYSREYTRVYTGPYHHFYMTNVYIFRERNSISCAFVGGEGCREEAYTKGEKTYFYEKTLFCFVLLYACFFIALWCFELLLISILCCSHRIMFMCWACIHPYAIVIVCSDDLLLCHMIIVVISIWLSCIWSSCSYISHHVYFIAFLLVTLYLSFYYLLYLEGLMCFVQVF